MTYKDSRREFRGRPAQFNCRDAALSTVDMKSAAIVNGDYNSYAGARGNASHAITTAPESWAEVSGEYSAVAVALGKNSAVRGALGNWLVATEWGQNGSGGYVSSELWDVQAVKVDGKTILPNTWYVLRGHQWVALDPDDPVYPKGE